MKKINKERKRAKNNEETKQENARHKDFYLFLNFVVVHVWLTLVCTTYQVKNGVPGTSAGTESIYNLGLYHQFP